jgi:speckle-type POZ protein
MYGNLQERDFIAHRVALLGAAEKYDISDLKAACVDT